MDAPQHPLIVGQDKAVQIKAVGDHVIEQGCCSRN